MISLLPQEDKQIPLFRISYEEDEQLLNNPECEWYKILYRFPWKEYRNYGALYYEALYEFSKKVEHVSEIEAIGVETKEEARQRLLFDRATMQPVKERDNIIYNVELSEAEDDNVDPLSISPGVTPKRFGGKKPKCFFSLLKSFLGAVLIGYRPEPEDVDLLLRSNPSFARVCGFFPKSEMDEYSMGHIPSLRKLEQFDQIMRERGLWDKIKLEEVRSNLESGLIKKEDELVGDTTHYYAKSGFETVIYIDDKGKEQKKSQSKLTKKCRCEDKESCNHNWEFSDDGAGTIVKSIRKMYWGHKASILGYPSEGIPLDARAVTDASLHDGETLYPHVAKLFNDIPEIQGEVKRVLYDSACDNKDLKDRFQEDFAIELKASFNPRRKKEITEDLPRGIDRITPYGVPICQGGYEMDYKGIRYDKEKFIYQSPKNSEEETVCLDCPFRIDCCPNSLTGRTINISFDVLPHIDTDDPPMAKRYKAIMSRRPSVERMIKRLKCDLGDDRLSKRGNDSFQAYLDKTMIAYHILLRN